MATFNGTAYKYEKKRFYLSLVGNLSSIHELLSFCDPAIITVKIKEPLPHTAL